MKTIRIYYSLALILLFVSCNKTEDKPNLNLDNIVKIEIYNRSYKVDQDHWNKKHQRRAKITDPDLIKKIVDILKQTKPLGKEEGAGGTYGAIEVDLYNDKGEEFNYRNIYTIYNGVRMSYNEKGAFIKEYKNTDFAVLIEELLYKGETFEDFLGKVNEALNKK